MGANKSTLRSSIRRFTLLDTPHSTCYAILRAKKILNPCAAADVHYGGEQILLGSLPALGMNCTLCMALFAICALNQLLSPQRCAFRVMIYFVAPALPKCRTHPPSPLPPPHTTTHKTLTPFNLNLVRSAADQRFLRNCCCPASRHHINRCWPTKCAGLWRRWRSSNGCDAALSRRYRL